MDPTFEWDEQKNKENQRKHGVAFEEAQPAFQDPRRVILRDAEHSDEEDRYFLLGRTDRGHFDRTLHMAQRQDTDHWRRLLAQRQKAI